MINAPGFDGTFYWWIGVVENRNDPLKLGRCQVRIFGSYTDDLNKMSLEELPWAYPVQPINSAGMNGIGQTPLGPVEGTHVLGFFKDGSNSQIPMILGVLGGIPQEIAAPDLGFNDPNEKYPKEDFIGEPDTNRLADETRLETHKIIKTKIPEKEVPIALSSDTWDEPPTLKTSTYPNNHVYETESGHVQEFDDTPGYERIHTFHTDGSFEEYRVDGEHVRKIVGNSFDITVKDKNVLIKGDCNVTINGNANIRTNGDLNMETDGSVYHHVTGEYHIDAAEKITLESESFVIIQGSSILLN